MIKLLSIISITVQCYGSYQGYSGGGGGYGGAIPAAVRSTWKLDVQPFQLQQDPIQAQVIEVPALELPVRIIYHSKSSGIFAQQIHTPGEPVQQETTRSEEEPHRLSHEVVRPVIQELRELIIPYRSVTQEIAPVVEDVRTLVARGEGRQNTVQGLAGGSVVALGGGPVLNLGGLGGGIGPKTSGISTLFGGNGLGINGGGGYGSKSDHGNSGDGLDASTKRAAAGKAA